MNSFKGPGTGQRLGGEPREGRPISRLVVEYEAKMRGQEKGYSENRRPGKREIEEGSNEHVKKKRTE